MNGKIRAMAVAAMLLCSFALVAVGVFGDFGGVGNKGILATLSPTQSVCMTKGKVSAAENKISDAAYAVNNADTKATYVINTDSKVIHHPWCAYAKSMNEENKDVVNTTMSKMLQDGYKPCGRCKP